MSGDRAPRILLGVTGSVAAFKAPDLVREIRDRGGEVACVMTAAATRFLGAATLEAMSGNPVGVDLFDPRSRALPAFIEAVELVAGVLDPHRALLFVPEGDEASQADARRAPAGAG